MIIVISYMTILNSLAIICLYYNHKRNEKENEDLNNRILQLEKRIETCKLELYGRINAIKYNIPDNIDINNLKRKVKK